MTLDGHCEEDCPCRNAARRDRATLKAARAFADRTRGVLDACRAEDFDEGALRLFVTEHPTLTGFAEAVLAFRAEEKGRGR